MLAEARPYSGAEPEASPIDSCASIVEVLKLRAATRPAAPVFTFLHNGEAALDPLTFGHLDLQAKRFAASLRHVVSPRSRVILMLPAGYTFIEALFGCFYAGCVPVPVAPPRKRDFASPRRRAPDDGPLAEKIARDADAAALITTAEWSRLLRETDDASQLRVADIRHILPAELADGPMPSATAGMMHLPDPQALAYLQYTSGSTGDPRGVMVRHANIVAAVRASAAAFEITEQSRFVSWLPHYHDMGLVGSLFQAIYCGAQCWFMSPHSFIAKPDRWLTAITKFGATISGGPNFAYELCTRAAAQRAHEFRLSTWECAYNGSEPVRLDTLNEFAAAFATSGFKFENFRPCYGLAEATLQVSGGPMRRRAPVHRVSADATAGTALERTGVSCGRPVEGTEMRIVDPDRLTPVPDGAVGEVWIRGAQVGSGYWGKPGPSRDVFGARLAGDPHELTYMRTGDAGMIADGELFVLGRFKDAIILNGVNHHPEPIEATIAQLLTARRLGTVAAVGASIDGRERLVVVAEVSTRSLHRRFAFDELCGELRAVVHRAHDLPVHSIVLVPNLHLPRTTSGKVRRHKVKELYLSGRLDVVRVDGVASGLVAAADEPKSHVSADEPGAAAAFETLALRAARRRG